MTRLPPPRPRTLAPGLALLLAVGLVACAATRAPVSDGAGMTAPRSQPAALLTSTVIPAEALRVPRAAGRVAPERGARGGRVVALTGRGRAVARARLAATGGVRVRARGQTCRGAPELVLTLDGRRVMRRTVTSSRWVSLAARWRSGAGRHRIELELGNPQRSGRCVRTLIIDELAFTPPPVWRPAPNTTWQWQLTTPVDTSVDAQLYDIDLADNSAEVVKNLHAKRRRVVCYLNAGAYEDWRADAGRFSPSLLGKPLDGWPGERWLDIRRLDVLRPIMERRLDECRAKGFDGVEPDNIDGYANDTGFPLSAAHQLAFNRFIARAAHARGLSVGLKNDGAQAAELQPEFDWTLNEECFSNGECDQLSVFRRAGKAVFVAEYNLAPVAFCSRARSLGFMAMRKRPELDAWREVCW